MPDFTSRRHFLWLLRGLAGAAALTALPRRTSALKRSEHPEPRPEMDGSTVLTHEQLGDISPEIIAIYDKVREMPQIADGIFCTCGCSLLPNHYSLLTCYEENGMARGCLICQGTANQAYRRWKEGQSLDRIRRALDARYG